MKNIEKGIVTIRYEKLDKHNNYKIILIQLFEYMYIFRASLKTLKW